MLQYLKNKWHFFNSILVLQIWKLNKVTCPFFSTIKISYTPSVLCNWFNKRYHMICSINKNVITLKFWPFNLKQSRNKIFCHPKAPHFLPLWIPNH
ncbi:hypothetical protein BpHYR1_017124 [Brachionus plicatilis]|uniref:Uncharacterized protein n=1 Tax=Brachionus plicatilis TaxID=10195 RepID=A0A3M7S652_BRAPC|nr:hypothetical protein BpHYR1_017124 [Brachionus plicatilis]